MTEEFQAEVSKNIDRLLNAHEMHQSSLDWLRQTLPYRYSYNFSWLGQPIIQYPQDIVAIQELIWRIKPDLIIETGVAHGGSLILSASLLALLDYCNAKTSGGSLEETAKGRCVIGIEIDIRPHNRLAIQSHPLAHKIELIEGSSISQEVVAKVRDRAKPYNRIMVFLDSNHTHEHVLAELDAYAPFVSVGSYCVVFDTVIEHLPQDCYPNRPWGPGNSPLTAVRRFISSLAAQRRTGNDGRPLHFEVDSRLDSKLLITVAPGGYLRRTVVDA